MTCFAQFLKLRAPCVGNNAGVLGKRKWGDSGIYWTREGPGSPSVQNRSMPVLGIRRLSSSMDRFGLGGTADGKPKLPTPNEICPFATLCLQSYVSGLPREPGRRRRSMFEARGLPLSCVNWHNVSCRLGRFQRDVYARRSATDAILPPMLTK